MRTLDTNVLVAAFATRGFCLDIPQFVLARHRLLVGETVLGELERILAVRLRVPHERVGVGLANPRSARRAPARGDNGGRET